MTEFECKGVIGSSVYIAPHQSSAKYRVLVNDDNYANWLMCGQCYSKYQEENAIDNVIKKMSESELEEIIDEVNEV